MEVELIIPTRKLRDRHDKRQSSFKGEKLMADLLMITEQFLEDVFDDEIEDGYVGIYNFHLEKFTKVVDWNYKHRKPKYYRINENYFSELFRPIERF